MHHHKWNIEHIDNLMPWEKEIYVNLLVQFLKEEELKQKEEDDRWRDEKLEERRGKGARLA